MNVNKNRAIKLIRTSRLARLAKLEVKNSLRFGLIQGWKAKKGNVKILKSKIGLITRHFDVEQVIYEYESRIAENPSRRFEERRILRILAYKYSTLLFSCSKGNPDEHSILYAKLLLKTKGSCEIYPCGG